MQLDIENYYSLAMSDESGAIVGLWRSGVIAGSMRAAPEAGSPALFWLFSLPSYELGRIPKS